MSHRGPPTGHPKLCACAVGVVGLSAWGDVSNPWLRIPDIPRPPSQLAALHNFIFFSDVRAVCCQINIIVNAGWSFSAEVA
jgi:hypothetical protein